MKYLITGAYGFVGSYLIRHILSQDPSASIVALDVAQTKHIPGVSASYTIDMLDALRMDEILEREKPDAVVHLAALSSVAYSWKNPIASFSNNTNIFLNLLESLRLHSPHAIVLSIGSSEEYGVVTKEELPLREQNPLRPVSPYAVARIAQEQLSSVYTHGYGIKVICTRSFNHIGPYQSDQFVVSSMAKKIVEFKKHLRSEIPIGTLDIIRDFLDVRDVVRAYYSLIHKGVPGEVYNICSGTGRTLREVFEMLAGIAGVHPSIVEDAALMRPAENPIVVGSSEKIAAATGWKPEIDFRTSLADVLAYYDSVIPEK